MCQHVPQQMLHPNGTERFHNVLIHDHGLHQVISSDECTTSLIYIRPELNEPMQETYSADTSYNYY